MVSAVLYVSHYISAYLDAHIGQQCALHVSTESDNPESTLVEQKQLAFLAKAKVCNASRNLDLAEQTASCTPNVHTIAAPAIDITSNITFDTVGDAYAISQPSPLQWRHGYAPSSAMANTLLLARNCEPLLSITSKAYLEHDQRRWLSASMALTRSMIASSRYSRLHVSSLYL